jgi:hypothetical protein
MWNLFSDIAMRLTFHRRDSSDRATPIQGGVVTFAHFKGVKDRSGTTN